MIDVEAYRRDGYAIVRKVFAPHEIAEIGAAIDTVHAEGVAHGRKFRHGNLFYDMGSDGEVRMVQWPSYHRPVLNAVRLAPRMAALLAPLIGGDLKSIINQLHWKRPGGQSDFAWHQDSRFRRPAAAYRNLGTSYVQTGLAIDPHGPASGGMRVVRASQVHGALLLDMTSEVRGRAMDDAALVEAGLDACDIVDIELDPGDLALWNPYLVHASGANTADHLRRFYINGYIRAVDCDRGEPAFRDGLPVPLGDRPVLVHYEALHEHGEPHYL